ncbi:peptidase S28 [Armillaria fumosa]|nr:peptidase S28 [Armillaria fumosa]
MRWILLVLAPLSCLLGLTSAVLKDGRPHANMMPMPIFPTVEAPYLASTAQARATVAYDTVYYFDQLIDHNNASLGTFQQRYWHTSEYYESGGPIILLTPGENNAETYYPFLTNISIFGQIAQQQHGAVVILEHRFYGASNPYPDLSSESLRVLTIPQAINDFVYFAKNVKLPMTNGDQLGPDKAPWILAGGSYSGALVSWTMVNNPGLFYAGYASSAVVEAITDFWQYYEPIRQYMPANCSADVAAVIAYVDEVFTGSNTTAIDSVKETFGMSELTHLDDAAGALRNNLWDWQNLQPTSGPNAQFYKFCDALEVKDGISAPTDGWGLEHALASWGAYFKGEYLAYLCGDLSVLVCLGTYDATLDYYTNIEVGNSYRSWMWTVCNEVGWYQGGPPEGHPSIVSKLVDTDTLYTQRQCVLMFPDAFSVPPEPSVATTNSRYTGWGVQANRLFFANADRDPWRGATMSADGLGILGTLLQPIFVGNGFHCSDLRVANAEADISVAEVQTQALLSMSSWLGDWKPSS